MLQGILRTVQMAGERGRAEIPGGWAQGRATFGGLQVALALRAMRTRVEEDRLPRSLLTTFVGPVGVGEVELTVETLRQGRSATLLRADLLQEGTVRCSVQGAFGAERESTVAVEGTPSPTVPGPDEDLWKLPYVEGVTPEFTRRFRYRFAIGSGPYSGVDSREMGGWCRFRNTSEPVAEEHVLCLVDAWPAPILPMMNEPAPASSVTWALDFIQPMPEALSSDWWLFRSEVDHAGHGYGQFDGALWSPDGRLVALARQTFVVFG